MSQQIRSLLNTFRTFDKTKRKMKRRRQRDVDVETLRRPRRFVFRFILFSSSFRFRIGSEHFRLLGNAFRTVFHPYFIFVLSSFNSEFTRTGASRLSFQADRCSTSEAQMKFGFQKKQKHKRRVRKQKKKAASTPNDRYVFESGDVCHQWLSTVWWSLTPYYGCHRLVMYRATGEPYSTHAWLCSCVATIFA